MDRGLQGRPGGVQHTFTVCLWGLFKPLLNAALIYLYLVTQSFIAFGVKFRKAFFILRLLKKSIPCLLLAFYGFITNIKLLDPFEFISVLGK